MARVADRRRRADREYASLWSPCFGGALFLRTYRHLYEGEKRIHAARLDAFVRASLDKEGTSPPGNREEWLNEADSGDGRTWDRTRDLSRVKRALSR